MPTNSEEHPAAPKQPAQKLQPTPSAPRHLAVGVLRRHLDDDVVRAAPALRPFRQSFSGRGAAHGLNGDQDEENVRAGVLEGLLVLRAGDDNGHDDEREETKTVCST